MSELVSLSDEINSLKTKVKKLNEAYVDRLELLKEYMEVENIKELTFKDVVFTLADSSKNSRITTEDKRRHVAETLQEQGVAVDKGLIDQLLAFPKEKFATKKLVLKK
jgi:hypothetical protein